MVAVVIVLYIDITYFEDLGLFSRGIKYYTECIACNISNNG